MLQELLKYVLPVEIVEYFELTDISTDINNELEVLHLHLDEKNVPPPEYAHIKLSGNGFYESSAIKDFPLEASTMVTFTDHSFTVTVETIINPIETWQDLQNSIIECLAAASSDLLRIEAARPLLALLEELQPDWKTAKKMTE